MDLSVRTARLWGAPRLADLAIAEGRISRVAPRQAERAPREINAAGRPRMFESLSAWATNWTRRS
jgi:hypothetical protein